MQIAYEKDTLANGLDVLVHEDRNCPIVAVNVWYHVGSKDERRGRTGFAHLFEHLMFEGSEHYDRGYFHPLQQAGAAVNGSTNTDRTNYWEVVPSNAVDLALWMESDRMGFLLPALTPEKFANQRDVVLNERRQNYENRPYGLAGIATVAALFGGQHPYGWPTIGFPEDLRAADLEDVRDFFRAHYHPANASLVLAGDIEAPRAFELARRYFDDIPPGPVPARPAAGAPRLDREIRVVLEDQVELPRLYLAWHSPALFEDGDAPLDLLADVLANGKTSRLYRELVYDARVATELGAVQSSRELCSFFHLVATAAPGHHVSELYDAMIATIARVAREGVTAEELARGRAQAEAHFVYRLQTVGGFGGISDQLNAYNVFLGDPGYFNRDLDRYRSATAESIAGGAAAWLAGAPPVAVSVVPRGRPDLALEGSVPAVVS